MTNVRIDQFQQGTGSCSSPFVGYKIQACHQTKGELKERLLVVLLLLFPRHVCRSKNGEGIKQHELAVTE